MAALLAHSSTIGAVYNVRINLLNLDEVEIKEKTIEISKNGEINLSKTLEKS